MGEQHAPLVGVEAQADRDAIENQRRFVVDSRKHDGSAGKAQLPIGNAVVGRLKMGQQCDPVGAGDDLEGRNQYAPSGIPFEIHFRRIDSHRIIGRSVVDDGSCARGDFAAEIGRQAVPAQFTLQFAGQGQVGAVGQVLQPQRQQDIRGRDLVGANIDRSHAVGGRSDRNAKRPGVASLFADAQRHPAAVRPAKTERNVFEIPFVAALLVVDDQASVLQTDLIEILSIQSGQAEAVEPIEAGKQSVLGTVRRWRSDSGRWCAGDLARKRGRNARLFFRCDTGSQRLGVVTRRNRNIAVGRDAHREFGVNQIEALGAKSPHQ